MASLVWRSGANSTHSPNDDDMEDDESSTEPAKLLDSQFVALVGATIRKFPELQHSDLYAALLRSARIHSDERFTRSLTKNRHNLNILYAIAILVVSVILAILVIQPFIAYVLGIRCFVPNNYLVWEATRPVSDCSYCRSVRRPLILPNMTREEFMVCILLFV